MQAGISELPFVVVIQGVVEFDDLDLFLGGVGGNNTDAGCPGYPDLRYHFGCDVGIRQLEKTMVFGGDNLLQNFLGHGPLQSYDMLSVQSLEGNINGLEKKKKRGGCPSS
jgi:hypothetical protein